MKTSKVMLCVVIIILSSTLLIAQSATEKGRIITDVDFRLSSGNHDVDDAWGTEVDHYLLGTDIGIGYTVIDNLEIGLVLSVDNESIDSKNEFHESKTTESIMLYSVSARYFLMKEKALRPFVSVLGGVGTSKTTETGNEDTKANITGFGGSIGVAYFINSNVGVELRGVYQIQDIADNDNHEYSSDISSTWFHIAVGTIVSF